MIYCFLGLSCTALEQEQYVPELKKHSVITSVFDHAREKLLAEMIALLLEFHQLNFQFIDFSISLNDTLGRLF